MIHAFQADGDTVNINVSASAQPIQISNAKGGIDVLIMNNGTATVWIKFGKSDVEATTAAGRPVGPGVETVQRIPPLGDALFVSAIAAGSTGRIYFTPGTGI